MKLALGMMVTAGEAPYLRLHLPLIADKFDGAVIMIDPHEDLYSELQVLADLPFPFMTVTHREFDSDWSAHFNALIDTAERWSFDALLRLDPDEAMFPTDIDKVRQALERYDLLYLSRVNFWMDRLHYSPQYGNDYQGRAWRLNECIRLGGKHHESPRGVGNKHPILTEQLPDVTIYHYGDVGRERILKRDLHYLNVAREQAGHPPLTERPADREFPTRENVVYNGKQPLDPYKVGIYAPFIE